MNHNHQLSKALQALSALAMPRAPQPSIASPQNQPGTENPYPVERDAFGIINPKGRLYKLRPLISRLASRVRKKRHADRELKELIQPLRGYQKNTNATIVELTNYVCAQAYDDMMKDGVGRDEAATTCTALEAKLKERLQNVCEGAHFDACARYDSELSNPRSQLNTRIKAIHKLHRLQKERGYTMYLKALYAALTLLEQAKLMLSSEGKKRYELFIAQSASELKGAFAKSLTVAQMQTLSTLLEIPPRRSAAKDIGEIGRAQGEVNAAIEKYRYHHIDYGYLSYVDYIAKLIPHNQPLPPSVAKLLIHEALILCDDAKSEGSCLDGRSVSSRSLWNRPGAERQFDVVRTMIDGIL
ncbi:hypothetical protein S922_09050 [Salmonella enterica subsp. enterica]|nr:hypothetical protein [Salmonella enterica subsp. enterica]EAW9771291.1 hypothetical protein [Salmonella enterica]